MIIARELDDWLAYIRTVHFRSIDLSLDRVRSVLDRLPTRPAFTVIAVGGTNGKGSCAALLGSMLSECGYRAGVYTSPHLVRFNERVRIEGAMVGDHELCEAFECIEALRGDLPLTYFEFATLAAVYLYQQAFVDIAVMEIGMGGRLDAVNALPIDAALITNVGLDHMRWLGRDREAIGREKAHIMRAGRPVVFNHRNPPRSVTEYAAAGGIHMLVAGRDYRHEITAGGWRWHGPGGELWDLPAPGIPGDVQFGNASGVLALLRSCPGLSIDAAAAARGLGKVRVPARCEIVARTPTIMVDVAHNASAIETLQAQLLANPVTGKTTAVFGMLKDKDPVGATRAMDRHIDGWCLASISDERGQDSAELAALVRPWAHGAVHCHGSTAEAFDCALEHSGPDDRIVAFGSFHIAGDILVHTKQLA